MTELPIYVPGAPVCRMPQYQCCKYRTHCRLHPVCKQMSLDAVKVCKMDCPSCTYEGCSLSAEDRKAHPIYREHINLDPIEPIDEATLFRERRKHTLQHHRLYEYYNKMFGDFNQRAADRERKRYAEDPEKHRQRARDWYNKHLKSTTTPSIPEDIMPPCRLDCENCPNEDCVLPTDWKRKAWQARWVANNPDYHSHYREKHREEIRAADRVYYAKHREKILQRQKEHRQRPEVQAARSAYDKAYRIAHPEKAKARKRRYLETHRDKINARRREKRKQQKEGAVA